MVIPDGNHSLDVWKCPNGEIKFTTQTFFDVNKNTIPEKPHPAAKKLFRLHKGDAVRLQKGGHDSLMIVKTIRPSGELIGIVPHASVMGGDDVTMWQMFNKFKKDKLRKVQVTILGGVVDPLKEIWNE